MSLLTPSPDVDGNGTVERSFDFSNSQNIQEVNFGVIWVDGALRWIPMALSTLGPATSPHLSVIRLDFARSHIVTRAVETLIHETSHDLQRVASEVARIEREFKGAVEVTVRRDPVFEEALDTLNVRFRFCGVDDTS